MGKYYKVFLLVLVLFLFIGCVSASSCNDEAGNVSTSSSSDTIDIEDNSYSYSTEYATKPTKEIKTNKLKSAKTEDATGDILTEEVSDYDNQNDDMISLNNESLYEDYQNDEEVSSDINRASVSYSYKGVLSATNNTVNYIDNNHHLPGVVVIDGKNVTINEYLLITCKALNTTNSITINNTYSHCTSVTGTNYPGTTLNKTQYLLLARNIIKCYDINGKNPYNIRTENKYTMCFDDAVYYYSKILAYKSSNNKLPDSMKMVALYNLDYSSQSDALIVNSSKPFTITANYKSIGNNKYNFTLTSSETATIYYTRNGTTPTTNSLKYDGTLQIYNNTLIKYFGINKNNIKTPVLEFGIYEDSTPYISSKPALNKDKVNYNITLSASQKSKIYYTLNGSRPTTKSTLYTKTINTLTNYTILQYISVTDKNKTSPIYYYHILNPTPYITIINNTEVRDNHQNVSILGNKPGQVYYTRNGTTPTSSGMVYKHKLTDLLITTQLQAILIDKDSKQSLVTTYQSPKIITPAVATVMPQTTLVNGIQVIRFASNKENTTLYYTTDGSNPYNSNTTKTVRIGKDMKVSSKVTLKYYTRDENQFRSAIYTYTPPQSSQERPTITIYNTTRIYSNNEQRIVIQSNQPGTIDHTRFRSNGTFTYKYTREMIVSKNEHIHVYSMYGNKSSQLVDYNPVNGTHSMMNYSYSVKLPDVESHSLRIYSDNLYSLSFTSNSIKYSSSDDDSIKSTKSSVLIDLTDNTINDVSSDYSINTEGLLVENKNDSLILTYYSITDEDLNAINVVYSSYFEGVEVLTIYTNYNSKAYIYIYKNSGNETIETEFKTNSHNITKKETITYKPQATTGCGNYDILQTYTISNKIITIDDWNQTTNYLSNRYYNETDYTIITPQYRTHLETIQFLALTNAYAQYISQKLNTTLIISDEIICMAGIENDRMNYIHYPDVLLGLTINSNTTNIKSFNQFLSYYTYKYASFTLNTIEYGSATTTIEELAYLMLDNATVIFTVDNRTHEMIINPEVTNNVTITYDNITGTITCGLLINGFNYIGAITEPLTSNTTIITRSSTNPICYEDRLSDDYIKNNQNLFGYPLDSDFADLENTIGGVLVGVGFPMILANNLVNPVGTVIGGIMVISGSLMIADSYGFFSGKYNLTRLLFSSLDIGLSLTPLKIVNKIPFGTIATVLNSKSLNNGEKIIKVVKFGLEGLNTAKNQAITYVRDELVKSGFEGFIEYITPYYNNFKSSISW